MNENKESLGFFNKIGKAIILVLQKIAILFGFNKNSKFVSNYLNESNAKAGLYMGAIICLLEIWLIIRQTNKYLIPGWGSFSSTYANGFDFIFAYISQYILFFLVGLVIFIYALTYRNKKISDKLSFILNIISSNLLLFYSLFVIKETRMPGFKPFDTEPNILSNVLLIALYIAAFLLANATATSIVLRHFKKIDSQVINILVIALFAIICLSFGVKVSYSDHISSKHKEIICFLTMIIYATCLLVWRPWISILLNVGIFLGFYMLIHGSDVARNLASEDQLAFKDGDQVNYITFLVSLVMVSIMLYHQRRSAAIKDEELDYLANYDTLTGLNNFDYFLREVDNYQNATLGSKRDKIFLYININDFKLYNDQKGFVEGNKFLKKFGHLLKSQFSEAIVCRQTDDHYIVFCDTIAFEEKIKSFHDEVQALDELISVEISVGGYRLGENNEDVRRMVDKSRFACSAISEQRNALFLEYDLKMHKAYHLMQYVIHNVDKAVEGGWVRPYYQPVVYCNDQKLCGVEALCRWIDPKHGFLTPNNFIPTLEKTKLIYKVDSAIIETVCRDLRYCFDHNLPAVPVSINFSRLDFELMDAIGVLEKAVEKYNIPKEYLHIEITESALMEDAEMLMNAAKSLKEKDYALWLDDFGSGYSSLNVLKDYDFDVLKIDMLFLRNFQGNKKAKTLLESVISMADKLGMRTLSEGVETNEQREFLRSVGCEKLQGYLYGKPIPFEELQDKIKDGTYIVSDKLF